MLFAVGLLLTACFPQPRIQTETQGQQPLQGQILLWVELPSTETDNQTGSIQQVVQSSLEDFNKLYPNVKVFVEQFPFRQLQAPLQSQIQRGAGPDLLSVRANPDLISFIQAGLLRTISTAELDVSKFRTEALKNVRYQDNFYGLPLFLTTQVLCYNKTKVETLPKTLADLIQQARQGYSVGLMSGFLETYWGVGSFGGNSNQNADNVNDDNINGVVNDQKWRAWAQWLRWLKVAQNEPNFILSDDPTALRQAFLEGQLAYLSCRSDWLPDFSRILGTDTLGVTLLPGQPNQPASPILETGVLAFNQASSNRQYQLALRLAEFLTNAEQQKKIEAAIPFIPSNKLVTVNPQLFPVRATLQAQVKTALAISLDEMAPTEAVVQSGDRLYQQVLAGQISPSAAETDIKTIIQREFGLEE